ncbi:MAG: HD domain-containing protein [Anaerolineales bacterium]|nr:HD domain-containing protein [Anaerolineales bacterium]
MSLERPALESDADRERSPYAGRWVAQVRGQVVAQGGTPGQALWAAKASRGKENLEVVFMSPVQPYQFPSLLDRVLEVIPDDQLLYLVGGAVRDILLNRETHDLDFVVPRGGIRLGRLVANALGAEFFALDDERDTGRVILVDLDSRRHVLDFAVYRGPDLEADLKARDFTVNALAIDVRTQETYDPTGGAADLHSKHLRACSDRSFKEDPLRILRGVRLAATYKFQIQPETRKLMRAAVGSLETVSPERKRDELFRILEGASPDTAIRALEMLGVLPVVFPELPALKGVEQPKPHTFDVWNHTLGVLRHLEDILEVLAPGYQRSDESGDLFIGLLSGKLGRYREQFETHFADTLNTDRSVRAVLFLSALYHDVAKPMTRSIDPNGRLRFIGHDRLGTRMIAHRARDLRMSKDEIERLQNIVRNHMRIHNLTGRLMESGKLPSRRSIYRFFRDTGDAGVDVILLALADLRATYSLDLSREQWSACLDICRLLLENLWERPAEIVAPPPLLNGHELMAELKLEPGPLVGQVLEAMREAQATQAVSTRAEALEYAHSWLVENQHAVDS